MFEFVVKGIVQGVGFRPFIYNLASELNIRGYVQNTGTGVKIICDKKGFIEEIKNKLPPLARIDSIEVFNSKEEFCGKSFAIKQNEKGGSYSMIPADLNLCGDCIRELFDEEDRRYKYFFISCTNCGPRYSIIEGTPYDRNKTSLKDFELCDVCKREYKDPQNRRYYAQTIACPRCGPKLDLYIKGEKFKGNVIEKTVNLIESGKVIAAKGVGGFHLICRADKNGVVKKLKGILKRQYKPFALMGRDINMAEKYCYINDKERGILLSKQRPIVLLEKRKDEMREVSELSSLGFMLPHSPIHYLLFEYLDFPLVMTSSNLPSHPITTKREDQFVDYILDYNRNIVNFLDDSVIKVVDESPLLIRRSRGFAPNEIPLPEAYKLKGNILAVGSEMKNTFCIKKNNKLILSQHIGNIFNLENLENFKLTIDRLLKFTKTNPEVILCDYNLEFNTSKFAESLCFDVLSLVPIQHHIAHGFSVALEHNLETFLSIVCDGTGLGLDGNIWGGEIFHNDTRIGRLEYHNLIGGDMANREPKRILAGILSKFLDWEKIEQILGSESKIWLKQQEENFNCIASSSCGRILDCISVLLGFSNKNFYEGRGAMLLESNSKKCDLFFNPKISKDECGLFVLDTTCLIKFVYENLEKIDRRELAYFTQIYLVQGLLEIAKEYDENLPVCFSGGCAYNKFMSKFMIKNNVFLNKDIPCGDGGICVGQIGYWDWKNRR